MHTYTFIASLRANHPRDDLSFLTNLLRRQPTTSWVAGDSRKTPKGTQLGGIRSNSYWVTTLTEEETCSETWQVEDFLENCLIELAPHSKALEVFIQSGGRLVFYVSLYGARNFGLILSPDLMSRLAKSKFELDLDIYPGP
jgi:hypothetical protein